MSTEKNEKTEQKEVKNELLPRRVTRSMTRPNTNGKMDNNNNTSVFSDAEYSSSDFDDDAIPKQFTRRRSTRNRKQRIISNVGPDIDDDDDDYIPGRKRKRRRRSNSKKNKKNTAKSKRKTSRKTGDDEDDDAYIPSSLKKNKTKEKPKFNRDHVQSLHENYGDWHWKRLPAIQDVNNQHPLRLVPPSLIHPGNVYAMAFSPCGELLATSSTLGTVRVWDIKEWRQVQELRDEMEEQIDEFYVTQWTPDGKHVVAGGKRKDRLKWDRNDDDNAILPCPIKIFDVVEGFVVSNLDGHTEEVLCLKTVWFKGEFYLLSASYDGTIRKWFMSNDFITEKREHAIMEDGITNVALSLAFVPNCGNKYFLAGCDDYIKLYDFEHETLLQVFKTSYQSYCDCIKFLPSSTLVPLSNDDDATAETKVTNREEKSEEFDKHISKDSLNCISSEFGSDQYIITRGVELIDQEGNPQKQNKCHLWRFSFPSKDGGEFELKTIHEYCHNDYTSNCWLIKVATNGRYLFAPTANGRVFIWNIGTGALVAILADHEEYEVREIIFHPQKKLMLSCCDGIV